VTRRNTAILGIVLAAVLVLIAAVRARDNASPPTNVQASPAAAQPQSPTVTGANAARAIGLETFRDIAKAQTPMVVNIRTESRRQTRDLSQFFSDELLQRFFGAPEQGREPRDRITQGAGTGFVIDKNGLILTNNHVVAGANKISVALYAQEDGEEYDARVVGRDPLTDSALIELTEKPSQGLPVAALGNSRVVQPGDWVMAIGNPFNLAHTVTVGVISAVGRPFPVAEGHWQDVLQTDAAINPGNSGGPLLNLRGEVIGINSAIVAGGPVAGNVGVGFAIPIDLVRELLPQLRQGTITRGRIGVQIAPVTKDLAQPLGLNEARGALVRLVERGGPAASAGIQPGDVIVRYNEKDITKSNELVDLVTRTKPGTTVPVDIVRGGQRKTVRVTVDTLDVDDQEQSSTASSSDTGFGMALQDLGPQMREQLQVPSGRGGAVVTQVEPAGGAARAGLRPGDVIVEVNRSAVSNAREASAALKRVPEQEPALVLLLRQGQELFLTIARK
jgi:serine protease Do